MAKDGLNFTFTCADGQIYGVFFTSEPRARVRPSLQQAQQVVRPALTVLAPDTVGFNRNARAFL